MKWWTRRRRWNAPVSALFLVCNARPHLSISLRAPLYPLCLPLLCASIACGAWPACAPTTGQSRGGLLHGRGHLPPLRSVPAKGRRGGDVPAYPGRSQSETDGPISSCHSFFPLLTSLRPALPVTCRPPRSPSALSHSPVQRTPEEIAEQRRMVQQRQKEVREATNAYSHALARPHTMLPFTLA